MPRKKRSEAEKMLDKIRQYKAIAKDQSHYVAFRSNTVADLWSRAFAHLWKAERAIENVVAQIEKETT